MRNAYEVLKQKEEDLARVRREIESLRIVASLLLDDSDFHDADGTRLTSVEKTGDLDADIETENDGSSAENPRPRFWDALKRAR